MIEIMIKDREEAIKYTKQENTSKTVIISIESTNNDYKDSLNKSNKNVIEILTLKFDDIVEKDTRNTLMTTEHAKQIKNFIDKNKSKIDILLIHCDGGIARSAAIACAISMYIEGSDMGIWSKGLYSPNLHCYRTCLELFGFSVDQTEINKKQEISKNAFNKLCKEKNLDLDSIFI